jgi:hypothetical protein
LNRCDPSRKSTTRERLRSAVAVDWIKPKTCRTFVDQLIRSFPFCFS